MANVLTLLGTREESGDVENESSFLSTIKKFAHPSSIKNGRLTDKNDCDLEIPRAFKMHRNNIELQQMRETRLSGVFQTAGGRMRLNKQQLR